MNTALPACGATSSTTATTTSVFDSDAELLTDLVLLSLAAWTRTTWMWCLLLHLKSYSRVIIPVDLNFAGPSADSVDPGMNRCGQAEGDLGEGLIHPPLLDPQVPQSLQLTPYHLQKSHLQI